MEIHYDVPGSARKALASAIGEIIGTYPSYQAAPSFAYIIGEYTLDRNGVLTGPRNSQLLLTLDRDGYRTKKKDNRDPGTMPGVVVLAFYISIPICSGDADSVGRY